MLLADGRAVSISQLKPGEKVLATNVKTGKVQPETVQAVLVHHDSNLYDLRVSAGGRTLCGAGAAPLDRLPPPAGAGGDLRDRFAPRRLRSSPALRRRR